MDNISKHISYNEATLSQTAIRNNINNTPSEEIIANMKNVAINCFEPLREWYGKPIKVNSFYRSPALNKKIGGAKTSQHQFGEAIDMDCDSIIENKKIFEWCRDNLLFDQLIWEYGGKWVHISLKKENNRKQVLFIE